MGKDHHRLSDRKEGQRVRGLDPFNQFITYIMPTRMEAANLYEESFKINDVDGFLQKLRREGYKGIGLMHFAVAAYVRCLAKYPGLNRFVAGRRIYARNKIEVTMVVKREMTISGEETTIKVRFEPTDTITQIYEKMKVEIDGIKSSPESNNTEKVAAFFCHMPRILFRFAIMLVRVADYLDLIPRSVLAASPFHASVMITNTGSLGIGPVNHHLYNIGTLPVFMAIGSKRTAYEIDRTGKTVRNLYADLKFTIDERIQDGYYFAAFLREYRKVFVKPEMLLAYPAQVNKED
ncbi:MAG: hypothetical protein K6F87_09115 [Lachnospiraceae bacterium]|nr:hypothetical protein [Lachnospiraceae bacterium]